MKVTLGLLAKFEALPGKEQELADFLQQGLALANIEPDTVHWFAFRIGPSTLVYSTRLKRKKEEMHTSPVNWLPN